MRNRMQFSVNTPDLRQIRNLYFPFQTFCCKFYAAQTYFEFQSLMFARSRLLRSLRLMRLRSNEWRDSDVECFLSIPAKNFLGVLCPIHAADEKKLFSVGRSE